MIDPATGLWCALRLPVPNFDPGTMMVGSMAMSAVGSGISAAGTLAGGSYAKQAGVLQRQAAELHAVQLEQDATTAIAAGQRTMFDTQEKARLLSSSLQARAAASGGSADVGSPVELQGELAERGSYHALMDLFNGQNRAVGLRNQAAATRFGGEIAELEGDEKARAADMAALGTLAGGAGSLIKAGGGFAYPQYRWGS